MCGGSDRHRDDEKKTEEFKGVYTPPPLSSLYNTFRETGNIPYSYYGVSAPTREGELALARKSYPGAFVDAPLPQAPVPGNDPRRDLSMPSFFNKLFGAFSGRK